MMLSSLIEIVGIALAFVFALTIHEYAHGFAAKSFGDTTAQDAGRLSLNPLKHIDLVGTIGLPIALYLAHTLLGIPLILFGWAKPVPVDRRRLSNPRTHMPVVALAGPASNLAQAFCWAALYKIFSMTGLLTGDAESVASSILFVGIAINSVLMCLNLLPILPLDGGRALLEYLPRNLAYYYAKTERFGLPVLLLLILTASETGVDKAFLNIVLSVSQGILLTMNIDIKIF